MLIYPEAQHYHVEYLIYVAAYTYSNLYFILFFMNNSIVLLFYFALLLIQGQHCPTQPTKIGTFFLLIPYQNCDIIIMEMS
jgi:hypothetical protein